MPGRHFYVSEVEELHGTSRLRMLLSTYAEALDQAVKENVNWRQNLVRQ
jgi:hypothetical protein